MAYIKDRTGETSIANNGMKMKIIAYRGCNDIDIQFEDGIIVYSKSYVCFKTGVIGHPNRVWVNKGRIGEISIANNGMKMKIIAYRNYTDIDIQFEDGTIVYNRAYENFKKGSIGYPIGDRVGETSTANNGMKMKIIAYRKASDIDIQFEDGTIVYNKSYSCFKIGEIRYPQKDRVGEVSVSNNGMSMKIIAYRRCDDIDIQFEDGTIVYNRRYKDFKNGSIGYPIRSRVGEINTANNGMKMKIIAYRRCDDIDIQFEDGTIVYNKRYTDFKTGLISYPKKTKVGEINTANNGMKMKIIAYRKHTDIDVQFEDGAITYNKDYGCFKKGTIAHPDNEFKKNSRVGEVVITTNGMKAKVIAYRSAHDIDVQFEDGTIVYNKEYKSFLTGQIGYPRKSVVGEVITATNGLKMKIVACRHSKDIDVQFEDGTIVYSKAYNNFSRGRIGHPLIGKKKSDNFYNYKILNIAYKKGCEVYYLCEKDGDKMILSPQQIFKIVGVKVIF